MIMRWGEVNMNNGVKWRRFIVPKKFEQINDYQNGTAPWPCSWCYSQCIKYFHPSVFHHDKFSSFTFSDGHSDTRTKLVPLITRLSQTTPPHPHADWWFGAALPYAGQMWSRSMVKPPPSSRTHSPQRTLSKWSFDLLHCLLRHHRRLSECTLSPRQLGSDTAATAIVRHAICRR